MGLLLAFAQALLGVGLLGQGKWALGITNLVFGVLFVWVGLRRRARETTRTRELTSVGGHLEEINQRILRGETPDQIAESLDTGHGIAPMQTLFFLANDRLRLIGRGYDEDKSQLHLNWAGSGRRPELPPIEEMLDGLNARTNVYSGVDNISLVPPPGEPGKVVEGALLATRTHLLFLELHDKESLGKWAVKEVVTGRLGPLFGLASLAKDVTKQVKRELDQGITPALIAQYRMRLALPGSFAVPWREMVGVKKAEIPGQGPPRVALLLGHGDASAPTERWLTHGVGYDEVWVDDWVDAVRIACLLEGKLLAL